MFLHLDEYLLSHLQDLDKQIFENYHPAYPQLQQQYKYFVEILELI